MEIFLAGMMKVSPPLIEFDGIARRRFMVILVVLFVISFLISGLAASCGILAFVLLWRYAVKVAENKGITFNEICTCGALCIWLMLFAGILTI